MAQERENEDDTGLSHIYRQVHDVARRRLPAPVWDALRQAKENAKGGFRYPQVKDIRINSISYRVRFERLFQWENLESEKEFLRRMIEATTDTSIVYAVGASIGTHAIPLAMRARLGHVYCFEPDEEIAVALQQNINLNLLNNMTVYRFALWDLDCLLTLDTSGPTGQAPQTRAVDKPLSLTFDRHETVQAFSIASLVETGQPVPDILQIDVEGAALHVLKGLSGVEKLPKHIFIEVHPTFGEDIDVISQALQDARYQLSWSRERNGQIHCHFELAGS